jgi:hypothetical protein
MGLNDPLAFYEMHRNNVKQLSNFYGFPLQSKCEAKGAMQTILCKYRFLMLIGFFFACLFLTLLFDVFAN